MPADRGDAACIVAGVRKWRRCFESLAACVPSDAGNLQVHHCRAPAVLISASRPRHPTSRGRLEHIIVEWAVALDGGDRRVLPRRS
jgi:hypothetical protein